MLIFKTRIKPYPNEFHREEYLNKPVLDRFSEGLIYKDGLPEYDKEPKVIGVVTDAVLIEEEVELTITLWKNDFQIEWIDNKPSAFSMGFKSI